MSGSQKDLAANIWVASLDITFCEMSLCAQAPGVIHSSQALEFQRRVLAFADRGLENLGDIGAAENQSLDFRGAALKLNWC